MPAVLFGTLRLVIVVAVVLIAGTAPAAQGVWHKDFEEAQARATRLNRPILVHFYAEWCAPCKRMDRDVLHVGSFLETLNRTVVPVKLDVEAHDQLARKYRVESVPTDLFLTPDGRVLGMMNGYREMSDYLKRVAAISDQFARDRKLHWAGTDEGASAQNIVGSLGPEMPELELPSMGARQPTSADGSGQLSAPDHVSPGPVLKLREDGTILVGLKGFSPVALYSEQRWVKGEPHFSARYQGLTYLMAGESERSAFEARPERYAPRLLGCDPVLYFDEGRAVPGSVRLAVFYEDRLYLFASETSRRTFRESPLAYARRRTVLLPEELELTWE